MRNKKQDIATTVAAVVLWASFCLAASAFNVDITYGIGPGLPPGFNDTNRGAERQAALQKAVDIWETHLQGTVDLKIDARFIHFSASPGPLAAGQATSANANLGGLPLGDTWYHAALASELTGVSRPASAGPGEGFHMIAAFEDDFNAGAVGSRIWYYGLDGNPPGTDIDFVSVALHELAHAFGFSALINKETGEWANILVGIEPPPVLTFGDIFSRQLTRTPTQIGSPNDIDFWIMSAAQRFSAITSNEVYWKGPAVMGAAEFAPSPARFHQINFKGEILMFTPATLSNSSLSHWDDGHAGDLMMEPRFDIPPFDDIDVTKEAMIDIGWSVNSPPASGPVAWVDFSFTGEEFGSDVLPFNTFGEAVSFVTSGGTVNIRPGSSAETPAVSKAMTVNAVGGPASIGVPVARSAESASSEQRGTGFVSRRQEE